MIQRISPQAYNRQTSFKGNLGQEFKTTASSIKDLVTPDNNKEDLQETGAVVGASSAAIGATKLKKLTNTAKSCSKTKDSTVKSFMKHKKNLGQAAENAVEFMGKKPILKKLAKIANKPLVRKIGAPVLAGMSVLLVGVDVIKSLATTKDLVADAAEKIA